jgi:NADH-quinone oxidoreductase subunit M
MVLAGTFLWSKIATAFASLGIILAAAYLLWMVQRVAFGVPAPHMLPKLRDVNLREMVTLVPLVVLIFAIGLFPNPILTRMHPSVEKVIARVFPSASEQASTVNRVDPFPPSVEDVALPTELAYSRGTNNASRSLRGEASTEAVRRQP